MAELKAGTRIKSAVCTTEVMVIAAPAGDTDVTCGGVSMISLADTATAGAMDPAHAHGTLLGKRYVNTAVTLNCSALNREMARWRSVAKRWCSREAKALPSSD